MNFIEVVLFVLLWKAVLISKFCIPSRRLKMSKHKQVNKQTKTSIVDSIYKKTDHMLKDIHSVSDLFFAEMFQALQRGETIEIRGFGTFSVQFRKGRKGMRNPKTGEMVDTEDHSVVVFRPGKILSAAVRPLVEENSTDAKR